MVALIFDCDCKTCDGGIVSGKDEHGHMRFGGSHCVCSCHERERVLRQEIEVMKAKTADWLAAPRIITAKAHENKKLREEIERLEARIKELEAADFWKDIVVKDGELDVAQVKLELEDYHQILENVPKVYDMVTGGLLSKPNYEAEVVIAAFNDYVEREREQAFEEGRKAAQEPVDMENP